MDTSQRGVITLLKSAVTGKPGQLPQGFDLEAVYPNLKKHNMDALLYEGALVCGIAKQSPVMELLFRRYCQHLVVSEGQMRQVHRIFDAFEAKGIEYLPLKGCRMKGLYPKAELRYMGDADILIRMEQYDRIKPLMGELGFEEKAESDHELHWHHRELSVELHKRLIPSYNEDYCQYYGIGWEKAARREGCRWTMTAEDEWIYLFTHFAKHFRDGGIGCRYVVDLWVYLTHHPEMDEGYIRQELDKLGLGEFHGNIRQLINVWFEDDPGDDRTAVITDYIFSSGSWGRSESKAVSMAVRDSHGGSYRKGKAVYLLRTAFPDARTLNDKYTVLKKAPWLLPAVWVVRPFYKVLFEFRSLGRHKRNLTAMTGENVDERHRMLNEVGLDYNF